jgi:hypothetical protein
MFYYRMSTPSPAGSPPPTGAAGAACNLLLR